MLPSPRNYQPHNLKYNTFSPSSSSTAVSYGHSLPTKPSSSPSSLWLSHTNFFLPLSSPLQIHQSIFPWPSFLCYFHFGSHYLFLAFPSSFTLSVCSYRLILCNFINCILSEPCKVCCISLFVSDCITIIQITNVWYYSFILKFVDRTVQTKTAVS